MYVCQWCILLLLLLCVGGLEHKNKYPQPSFTYPLLPPTPPTKILFLQVVFCVGEYPVLMEFLRYFHRTWIETFPIEMWNVFERPSRLRTTNFCEGWNNAWNTHTRRASPNIWLAIKFLKIQQKNTENQIFHMRRGALPPPQKRKWRLHNEKIIAMKNSLLLGNRNIINYWKAMSHLRQSI